ncbi:unnamed protein product [Closterium sp. Yama58-4]|nr:unnamed protein product [Closterium sp. Yama58-4]
MPAQLAAWRFPAGAMGAEYLDARDRAKSPLPFLISSLSSCNPAGTFEAPQKPRGAMGAEFLGAGEQAEPAVDSPVDENLSGEPVAEGRTPMTLEQYRAWKARKDQEESARKEEAARKRAEDIAAGRVPMNGRELFIHEPWTREQAMAEFKKNPHDADNLTKLGRTLVELAQFIQGQESNEMLDDAVSKFDEALKIAPSRPDTLWWLGNAHTTRGFQTPDATLANVSFEKASDCFRKALDADPSNDAYRKSLEISLKGPELHQEVQKQMALQQALGAAVHPSSMDAPKVQKKKKSSDLWYDVAGWVILSVGVVAWLSILSARAPPPAAAK